MTRTIKVVAAVLVVLVGGTLVGAVLVPALAGGQTPSSGAVQVFVTPGSSSSSNSTSDGHVLITGAIGDYGPAKKVNSSGQPDAKGSYRLLELQHGTLLVNLTQINAAGNAASPTLNSSNCSATFSVTAPVPIVSGTGSYAGVTGSVAVTEAGAALLPKKNGSCNTSGKPLSQYMYVYGTGVIKTSSSSTTSSTP